MSTLAESPLILPFSRDLRSGDLVELHESCRFCGCTEERACVIAYYEDANGNYCLARNEEERQDVQPCSWFLPRVCNAPACIEALLLEALGRGVVLDSSGRRAG